MPSVRARLHQPLQQNRRFPGKMPLFNSQTYLYFSRVLQKEPISPRPSDPLKSKRWEVSYPAHLQPPLKLERWFYGGFYSLNKISRSGGAGLITDSILGPEQGCFTWTDKHNPGRDRLDLLERRSVPGCSDHGALSSNTPKSILFVKRYCSVNVITLKLWDVFYNSSWVNFKFN